MMQISWKKFALVFALAALAGFPLHSLYQWLPNPFFALFSPVNESIWEHGKLIYWPALAAALALGHGQRAHWFRPFAMSITVSVAVMNAAGYVYFGLLGRDDMVFSIVLYFLCLLLALLPPMLLKGPWNSLFWLFWLLLFLILGLALCVFPYYPPDGFLFMDPSVARTWSTIPC